MYTRRKKGSDRAFKLIVLVQLAVLAGMGGVWLRRHRSPENAAAMQTAQVRQNAPSAQDHPELLPVERPVGTAPIANTAPRREPSPQTRPPLPPLSQPSMIVEKGARRLHVLDQGRLVKTYVCAVGAAPGDKIREGDLRTPEGKFFVCVKNPTSRYTRALGLSYPNLDDARRGVRDGLITRSQYQHIAEELRFGRQPPWNTALGGEIMIHGQRGGSDRPTEGCIALEDADILELYPRIPTGTVVYIRP